VAGGAVSGAVFLTFAAAFSAFAVALAAFAAALCAATSGEACRTRPSARRMSATYGTRPACSLHLARRCARGGVPSLFGVTPSGFANLHRTRT
jgi:hypothetical protein